MQIGRLGWLENSSSQVLYICPDEMNLDICLLRNLVSVARPDINLDNLWIIQPEKNMDKMYHFITDIMISNLDIVSCI